MPLLVPRPSDLPAPRRLTDTRALRDVVLPEGYVGTSLSKRLVDAARALVLDRGVEALGPVEVTDEEALALDAALDGRPGAASWAVFGFTAEEVTAWREAGVRTAWNAYLDRAVGGTPYAHSLAALYVGALHRYGHRSEGTARSEHVRAVVEAIPEAALPGATTFPREREVRSFLSLGWTPREAVGFLAIGVDVELAGRLYRGYPRRDLLDVLTAATADGVPLEWAVRRAVNSILALAA